MLSLAVCVALLDIVAANFDPDLHAMYRKMPKSSFIEYFNKQNYSWTITEYDKKYNTPWLINFDSESFDSLPMLTHNLENINLSRNFDAREKWPHCTTINEIYYQGICSSHWTFGTATPASDRMCIHLDKIVRLAEQDFECLQDNVCSGGSAVSAHIFWQKEGLVTQDCKPYDVEKLLDDKCETSCINDNIDYDKDKHFAEKVYSLSNDTDQIKAELAENGPVQATFAVFEDFSDYERGVYEHKYGDIMNYHSVRVIGYGVENRVDYWLVANSWGAGWGESGWFRIKMNQKEVEFEEHMMAGIPKN